MNKYQAVVMENVMRGLGGEPPARAGEGWGFLRAPGSDTVEVPFVPGTVIVTVSWRDNEGEEPDTAAVNPLLAGER